MPQTITRNARDLVNDAMASVPAITAGADASSRGMMELRVDPESPAHKPELQRFAACPVVIPRAERLSQPAISEVRGIATAAQNAPPAASLVVAVANGTLGGLAKTTTGMTRMTELRDPVRRHGRPPSPL